MKWITVITLFLLVCSSLLGCYETTTLEALHQRVQRMRGNSFPGRLIFERSDARYDYYRIEDIGVRGRYRVSRESIK